MKRLTTILAVMLTLAAATVCDARVSLQAQVKLSDDLLASVETGQPDEVYDVLVSLGGDAATTGKLAATAPDLASRYRAVAGQLRSRASRSQITISKDVAAARLGSQTHILKTYWIADIMHVRTDRAGLLALAERDDVVAITKNAQVDLIEPVASGDIGSVYHAAEANLDAVGARAVWAAGYTGKGRLIASIDTGVDGDHDMLESSWRGRFGDTAASWFDPFHAPAPSDSNGHGTHVMGIMVGHTNTDTIGVAPGADWINAAVVDRGKSLGSTIADILSALEWVVDPDGNPATTDDVPDVVCNSWGISQQIINPCDPIFFDAIDNVEAMGIVCVFAAGNEGPNSSSIRNPADHASSPTTAFSVGAVDATLPTLPVPSFSSRGPSACDGVSIKPEIAAPGVAIYSSYKNNTYKTMNGTSMAAPFVAASVAILRQMNPNLTPEEIKEILLDAAVDLGTPGDDNSYGHGLLDLPEALASVPVPARPELLLQSYYVDKDGDEVLTPGETSTLAVTVSGSSADAHNLYGRLRPLSASVSVDVDSVYFGDLIEGATIQNDNDPFVMSVASSATIGDTLWVELALAGDPLLGDWTDTLGLACGLPVGADVETLVGTGGSISLTNFGHIGVGTPGALAAGGAGWSTALSSDNLLYEGAIFVASEAGGFADATRGSSLDFAPVTNVITTVEPDGDTYGSGTFDDSRAAQPVGVSVSQKVTMYGNASVGQYAVVEFELTNPGAQTLQNVSLGFLLDVDLRDGAAIAERAVPLTQELGFYNETANGSVVAGAATLSDYVQHIEYYSNPTGAKLPLDETQKRDALSGVANQPTGGYGDAFAIISTAPLDLGPQETVSFAVVLIAANSPATFAAAVGDARDKWLHFTDVNDGSGSGLVPRTYLDQNYPNPFNPETVIAFNLPQAGTARLDIYNILGQHVRTLINGWNPVGRHTVVWDGSDDAGRQVPSGVYLYRLQTGHESTARKMILLR